MCDMWEMCVRCVTKMVVDKIVVDEDVCEMCCVKDDV